MKRIWILVFLFSLMAEAQEIRGMKRLDNPTYSQFEKKLIQDALNAGYKRLNLNEVNNFRFFNISQRGDVMVFNYVGEICLTDPLSGQSYTRTSVLIYVKNFKVDEQGSSIEEASSVNQFYGSVSVTDEKGCLHIPVYLERRIDNKQPQTFHVNVQVFSNELSFYGQFSQKAHIK